MKLRKTLQFLSTVVRALAVPIALIAGLFKKPSGPKHVWNKFSWCERCGVPREMVENVPPWAGCGALDRAVIAAFDRREDKT